MISRRTTQVPTKDALREIAILALADVSKNAKATPAARAAAARTILETLGDIGRLQEVASRASKSTTELSVDELNEEIERLGLNAKGEPPPTQKQVDKEIKDLLTMKHRDIKA